MHVCARLNDELTRRCIQAERAVLSVLGGGCQVPIGAHATTHEGILYLQAIVIGTDGIQLVRREEQGPTNDARLVGQRCGEALLEGGAREILETVYGSTG
jgi:hydroxymethylbilane synthase